MPIRDVLGEAPGTSLCGHLAPGFDLEVRAADLWEPERNSEAVDFYYYSLMALKLH